jgi:hypothetical protein
VSLSLPRSYLLAVVNVALLVTSAETFWVTLPPSAAMRGCITLGYADAYRAATAAAFWEGSPGSIFEPARSGDKARYSASKP